MVRCGFVLGKKLIVRCIYVALCKSAYLCYGELSGFYSSWETPAVMMELNGVFLGFVLLLRHVTNGIGRNRSLFYRLRHPSLALNIVPIFRRGFSFVIINEVSNF